MEKIEKTSSNMKSLKEHDSEMYELIQLEKQLRFEKFKRKLIEN